MKKLFLSCLAVLFTVGVFAQKEGVYYGGSGYHANPFINYGFENLGIRNHGCFILSYDGGTAASYNALAIGSQPIQTFYIALGSTYTRGSLQLVLNPSEGDVQVRAVKYPSYRYPGSQFLDNSEGVVDWAFITDFYELRDHTANCFKFQMKFNPDMLKNQSSYTFTYYWNGVPYTTTFELRY